MRNSGDSSKGGELTGERLLKEGIDFSIGRIKKRNQTVESPSFILSSFTFHTFFKKKIKQIYYKFMSIFIMIDRLVKKNRREEIMFIINEYL